MNDNMVKTGELVEFFPCSEGLPRKMTGTVKGNRIFEGRPMLLIGTESNSFERRPDQVTRVSRT